MIKADLGRALARPEKSAILSTSAATPDASSMDEIQQIQSDVLMVEEALSGAPHGADRLAHRLKCIPRILTAVNARLGSPLDVHDIADVTQDAAVVVLGKLPSYEGRSSLEGWIYRICTLELMNAVRRKRRLPFPTGDILERIDRHGVAADPAPGYEPFEDVHLALEKLQSCDAGVIRLKHFEGLTFEEIGRLEDCPSSTIKSRYYRGLATLEGMLAPDRD